MDEDGQQYAGLGTTMRRTRTKRCTRSSSEDFRYKTGYVFLRQTRSVSCVSSGSALFEAEDAIECITGGNGHKMRGEEKGRKGDVLRNF